MVNDSGDIIIQVRAYRSSKFSNIYNKFSTKKNHVCCVKITAWIRTSCLWQTAAQHTKTNLSLDIPTLKIIHLNVITTTRTMCKMSNWGSEILFWNQEKWNYLNGRWQLWLSIVNTKQCVWNIRNAWQHSQLHTLNASCFMVLESLVFIWFHQPVSF